VVANLILDVIHTPLTNLSLQKLLYFAHGAHLLREKKPLVSGYFEAWTHGPVHPAVYSSFKEFKDRPITSRAYRKDIRTGELLDFPPITDDKIITSVRKVVISLADMTAGQLVNLSHAENGPWHAVYRRSKREHMLGLRISNEMIRERYKAHWLAAEKLERVDEPTEDSPLAYYGLG
jgi:uncharacterized phage-associated protein